MILKFSKYGQNMVSENAESYLPPLGTQTKTTSMFANVTANISGGIVD
jgi:hypothetical protein